MTWNGEPFHGAKIALLCDGQVLVYLRDAKPEIPFPNKWDLPGGGREGDEAPIECVLREVKEELGLELEPGRVHSWKRQAGVLPHGLAGFFCVAELAREEIASVTFGDEGQHWRMMPIAEFVEHNAAVPHLQERLRSYR